MNAIAKVCTSYFIDAIKTDQEVIWVQGNEYESPTKNELKKQYYVLMTLYDLSQTGYSEHVKREIDLIIKEEEIIRNPFESRKVFLSYSGQMKNWLII